MEFDAIDEMIFKDSTVGSIILHRKLFNSSLSEAHQFVIDRMAYLRENYPEKFPPVISARDMAFEALQETEGPVVAIEALWEGDTVNDWFTVIYAIARSLEPNVIYDEIYLSSVTSRNIRSTASDESIQEYTTKLVDDLANSVGAIAYHAPPIAGDEQPRWWLTEEAEQIKHRH